jgi:hypothetical protein
MVMMVAAAVIAVIVIAVVHAALRGEIDSLARSLPVERVTAHSQQSVLR